MALAMTVKSRIDVMDTTNGVNISLSKDTVNSASTQNYTVTQFQLPLSAVPASTAWTPLPTGDIAGLNQLAIHVTTAPTTFAGLGVVFATSLPAAATDPVLILQGSLLMSGGLLTSGYIVYVKNMDTAGAVTFDAVLGGVNA